MPTPAAMRNTPFLLLLALLLPMFAHANMPHPAWLKLYGGGDYDEGKTVIRTHDGNIAVTGGTESAGPGLMDGHFSLFDPDGRMIAQQVYGGSRVDRGKCIIELDNGDFLIAGYAQSFEDPGFRRVWVLRVGPTGDLIWDTIYGSGSVFATGFVIDPCPDGGYYIGGDYQAMNDGPRDAYAIRIDGDGNVIWENRFGLDRDVRMFYGAVTPDGNFALAGFERVAEDDFPDMYLVKVDKDGNQLWEGEYGTPSRDDARGIAILPDGRMVLAGETYPDGSTTSDIALAIVADDGTQLAWHEYGWNMSEQARHVEITSAGDIMVVGHSFSFGNAGDMLVMLIGQDGNERWSWHFGGEFNEFVKSSAEIRPGEFVFTGQTLSGPDPEGSMFLLKMDDVSESFSYPPDFGTPVFEQPAAPEQITQFRVGSVYPNPFNSQGRFSVQITQPGPIRVVVYDRLGRLVRVLADESVPVGERVYPLFADDLPSGMYFVQATSPIAGQVVTPFTVVK